MIRKSRIYVFSLLLPSEHESSFFFFYLCWEVFFCHFFIVTEKRIIFSLKPAEAISNLAKDDMCGVFKSSSLHNIRDYSSNNGIRIELNIIRCYKTSMCENQTPLETSPVFTCCVKEFLELRCDLIMFNWFLMMIVMWLISHVISPFSSPFSLRLKLRIDTNDFNAWWRLKTCFGLETFINMSLLLHKSLQEIPNYHLHFFIMELSTAFAFILNEAS